MGEIHTVEKVPYLISSHGVYRCVTYLLRGKYDSWRSRGQYSYKAIKKELNAWYQSRHFFDGSQAFDVFDGIEVWEDFLLRDPLLAERIEHQGFTSMEQLHHYAVNEVNK